MAIGPKHEEVIPNAIESHTLWLPNLQAEFQVNLTVPSDVVALSNMPEVSQEQDPDDPRKTKHVFSRTPKMSTYLLALVAGKLHNVTKVVQTEGGEKPISVWATQLR